MRQTMIVGMHLKTWRGVFPGCVAILLAGFCLAGCKQISREPSRTPPVSGEHYAHLFGQRYRTKMDLCLFIFNRDMEYKYIGINDGHTLFRPATLPVGVGVNDIGKTYGNITILDIVPAGSEFTIGAETHETTPLSGIRRMGGYPMGFICRLTCNGRQVNDALSEFIQSAEEAPPGIPNQAIDERIAERIIE
jgi:hypothetical protein